MTESIIEHLGIVGVSIKQTSPDVLDSIIFTEDYEKKEFLNLLAAKGISNSVLISTCNRVEVLFLSNYLTDGPTIIESLRKSRKIDDHVVIPFYTVSGEEAVRHIFRLAGGCDSIVAGEPQIFGQVKGAYFFSKGNNSIDHWFIDLLFNATFRAGKRIRTETSIQNGSLSITSVALAIMRHKIDCNGSKTVLVVGCGKMGKATLKYLMEIPGIGSITLTNRTASRALEIVTTYPGIHVLPFNEVKSRLHDFDIVITCISCPGYLISKDDVSIRKTGQIFVDIAMPRAIDPDISHIDSISLINMEMIKDVSSQNNVVKLKAARMAREIVSDEIEKLKIKCFERFSVDSFQKNIHRKVRDLLISCFREASDQEIDEAAQKITLMHLQKLKQHNLSLEERKRRLSFLKEVFM